MRWIIDEVKRILGSGPVEVVPLAFILVLILVFLMVLIWVLWGMYLVLDLWCLPEKSVMGKVLWRNFSPRTSHDSAQWHIGVEVLDTNKTLAVTESVFHYAAEGQSVEVFYCYGRISGKRYIKYATEPSK